MEEPKAGDGVGLRPRASGRLGGQRAILLQHVPPAVSAGLERGDDPGYVDTALAERHEQSVDDGLPEWLLAAADPLGSRRFDVLQMDVQDSVVCPPSDLDGIRSTEVEVPG